MRCGNWRSRAKMVVGGGGGVWNDVVSRMNWRRRIKGRLGGGGGRER